MSLIRLIIWISIIFAVSVPLLFLFNITQTKAGKEINAGVEVIAKGLEIPWSMDFLPDGRLIFTERGGKIKILDIESREIAELPVASIGEAGLLGLVVDPVFSETNHIYVYYTYQQESLYNRVSRFTLKDDQLSDEAIILDGIPGAGIHDGGRIKFGPDQKLYITTGDARQQSLAQDVDSLAGKILRINKDGSIPDDNPFPNNAVYSYGHRNPQGLAWHPITGKLYATEHGATRNDEVNIIEPGKNYGWPVTQCSDPRNGGMEYPILCFADETVAPAGAAFYTGDKEEWKNNLFFASLRGTHLHRVIFAGSRNVDREEKLLANYGRIRDVIYHEGFLYIATSNRDGRGFPLPGDDKILRIG